MKILICLAVFIVAVSCKMVEEAKVKECATKYKITDMSLMEKMLKPGFSSNNKDEKVILRYFFLKNVREN